MSPTATGRSFATASSGFHGPFQAKQWHKHTTKESIQASLLDEANRTRVFGADSEDEARLELDIERIGQVATRVWLITLSVQQEQLVLTKDHFFAIAELFVAHGSRSCSTPSWPHSTSPAPSPTARSCRPHRRPNPTRLPAAKHNQPSPSNQKLGLITEGDVQSGRPSGRAVSEMADERHGTTVRGSSNWGDARRSR